MIKLKKFGAEWCPSCKQQQKEFDKNLLNCTLECIDADDTDEEVLEELKIMSLPVSILYNDDIEVNRWVGYTPSKIINDYIETL